jgi:hypothetical protein
VHINKATRPQKILSSVGFKIYEPASIADYLSESSRFGNVKSAPFEDIAG